MNVEHGALSQSEWQKWLNEQNEAAYESFSASPEWLIAQYRQEKAHTYDYVGREVLELLQNAADAAEISKIQGTVRIELSSSALIVANTGSPFTQDGVASLRISHLSPKRHAKKNLIGNKGLGFRAILNWSSQPIILSHGLSISYSPEYSKKITEDFASRNKKIKQVLHDEFTSSGIWCAPLLLFPHPLYEEDQNDFKQNAILKRCIELREQGYDTVIGMPFNAIDSFMKAIEQITAIDSSFLIFINALNKIVISIENEKPKEWLKEHDGLYVNLHESTLRIDTSGNIIGKDTSSTSSWGIYHKDGVIPQNFIKEENDPDSFALVVARPLNKQLFTKKLYSFFPTSVNFPIGLLCHATLELEQNRKRIQENDVNEYILKHLALFILEITEKISCNKNAHFDAIDAIINIPFMQDDTSKFKNYFISEALAYSFFPTITGKVISGDCALLVKGASQTWLPAHVFPNVIELRNEQDFKFYMKLGVSILSAEDFLQMIGTNSNSLSKINRAGLIFGIKHYIQSSDYCSTTLFIDSNGGLMSNNEKFYPPGGQIKIKMPKWCNIKFVDSELWKNIKEHYDDNTDIRDIVADLEDFGIQEYAFQHILRGIIRDADSCLKKLNDNSDAVNIRIELLTTLMSLYKDSPQRQSIPALQSVYILTQSGEWKAPSKIYFGEGFGLVSGKILQEIFQNNLDRLACLPEHVGFGDHEPDFVVKFFAWLGVAEWPRLVKLNSYHDVDSKFKAYVIKKMKYPITFGEALICNSLDQYNLSFYDDIESFEHLKDILCGPYPAIVAWLAKDPQFAEIHDFQERNGTAYVYKKGGRKPQKLNGTIPSYILWKIHTTPWMLSSAETKLAPTSCFLGESTLEKFFPSPLSLNRVQEKQFNLAYGDILKGFDLAGVVMSLGSLRSDKIYEILQALPKSDQEGKRARSFYRWLLSQDNFYPDTESHAYKDFCANGMVFCQKEGKEFYASVQDTLHVDVEGIPAQLIAKENIAQFPKKRGAQKIRKIFGIETIDKSSVNETVEYFTTHTQSEHFSDDYKNCLKYIVALRQLQSSQQTHITQSIQRTQLELVSSLTKKITFKNNTIHYQLESWDFVIQNDTIYILYENTPGRRSLLAETIGNALAYLSGIADGSQFSRIFECEEAARNQLTKRIAGEEYEAQLQEILEAISKMPQ